MTQKLASSASSSWLTNSLICMALYGFWGFLSKLALVKGLSASQEATIEKVGFFMLMPLVMKPSSNDSGSSSSISSRPKMAILAALMSGASAAVASLFYSRAMAEGDAGAVSALTASYPPVTLMLGMAFGGETLTKNKLLGSILTVLGALLRAEVRAMIRCCVTMVGQLLYPSCNTLELDWRNENTGLDDFHWQTKQQLLQSNMLHLKAPWI